MRIEGTSAYMPPEFYIQGTYQAGPTTVWQLGALLYEMLNGDKQFNTSQFLLSESRFRMELRDLMTQGKTKLVSIQFLSFATNSVQSSDLLMDDCSFHPNLCLFSVVSLLRLPEFVEDVFDCEPSEARDPGTDAAAPLVQIILQPSTHPPPTTPCPEPGKDLSLLFE